MRLLLGPPPACAAARPWREAPRSGPVGPGEASDPVGSGPRGPVVRGAFRMKTREWGPCGSPAGRWGARVRYNRPCPGRPSLGASRAHPGPMGSEDGRLPAIRIRRQIQRRRLLKSPPGHRRRAGKHRPPPDFRDDPTPSLRPSPLRAVGSRSCLAGPAAAGPPDRRVSLEPAQQVRRAARAGPPLAVFAPLVRVGGAVCTARSLCVCARARRGRGPSRRGSLHRSQLVCVCARGAGGADSSGQSAPLEAVPQAGLAG